MQTSTFEFGLAEYNIAPGARQSGDELAAVVAQALSAHDYIVIDFEQARLTPSFVDQGIGSLVTWLGWEEFKRRIRMTNVTESDKPLVRHVVARRSALRAQVGPTKASPHQTIGLNTGNPCPTPRKVNELWTP